MALKFRLCMSEMLGCSGVRKSLCEEATSIKDDGCYEN